MHRPLVLTVVKQARVPYLVLDATVGSGLSNVGDGVALSSHVVYKYYEPGSGVELWVSDGTSAGTRLLEDIRPGVQDSNPTDLRLFQGRVFFHADDGIHGSELWSTDGTLAGTQLVKDLVAGPQGSAFSEDEVVVVGNKLFFAGWTPGSPGTVQLYVSDGTPAGTGVVKQIGSGATAQVTNLQKWGDRVVFRAVDGSGAEP